MAKTHKRVLSLILSLVMVLSLLPIQALAADPGAGSSQVSAEADGVVVNKEVTYDSGSYQLSLESYVTNEVTTTETTTPLDIVLVLDVSGSMDDPLGEETYYESETKNFSGFDLDFGKYYFLRDGKYYRVEIDGGMGRRYAYYTYNGGKVQLGGTGFMADILYSGTLYKKETRKVDKIDALKTAVNGFIDQVAANAASSDDVTHRISIVKFADDSKADKIGNDFIYWSGYNYTQIVKDLTDVSGSGATTLKNAVTDLSAAGATSVDYGLDLAEEVLNSSGHGAGVGARDDAKQVVIVFTDGQPNHGSGFSESVAATAVNKAKDLKDDKVTVFTVGVFEDADPSDTTEDFNQYMHGVSSNYPDATAKDWWDDADWGSLDLGIRAENSNYYLAATNADDLNAVFSSIASSIGTSKVEATESTVLTDTLSEYFDFPEGFDGSSNQITVTRVPVDSATGEWDLEKAENITSQVSITVKGKNIQVTGFDYTENAVTKTTAAGGAVTWSGAKLVLTFPIVPDKTTTSWRESGNYATNSVAPGSQAGLTNYKVDDKPGSLTLDGSTGTGGKDGSPIALVNTYQVKYTWSGLPEDETLYDADGEKVTVPDLPTGDGYYISGQTYTVDPREYPVLYTHDEYGNVNGKYTFSGWNKTGTQTMGDEDVTISGEWTYKAVEVAQATITFVVEEGGVNAGTTTDSGPINRPFPNPPDTTATTGYTFDGWFDEADSKVTTWPATVTKDATYTAEFSRNQFTVTWMNGDTQLEKDENVLYGTDPSYGGATPTKASTDSTDYTFAGWSEDPNATAADAKQVTELPVVTDDVTYYAIFSESARQYSITVNYVSDDGKTLKNAETATAAYNSAYDVTAQIPAFIEYQGTNYAKDTVDGAISGTVQGDVVITVIYSVDKIGVEDPDEPDGTPDKYQKKVTFDVANGSWNDETETQKEAVVTLYAADGETWDKNGTGYLTAEQIPAVGEKPDTGYQAGSWGDTTPTTDLAITADRSFTYTYAPADDTMYKVEHYKQNLDGTGYELADTETKYGTTGATATAEPKTYEGFTYDSTVAGTVASGTIKADGSLVLELYYTRNSYEVKYEYTNTVPGASALPETASYKYGATVTVAADAAATGYTFSGWSSDDAAISDGTFTMPAEAVTITGSFTANEYKLTIKNVFTDGTSAPPATSRDVAFGSDVTARALSVSATKGYTVRVAVEPQEAGLTVADDQRSVTGTMPASDVTITFTYTPITVMLGADAQIVKVDGEGQALNGAAFTFGGATLTANGNIFSLEGKTVTYGQTYTITETAPVGYTGVDSFQVELDSDGESLKLVSSNSDVSINRFAITVTNRINQYDLKVEHVYKGGPKNGEAVIPATKQEYAYGASVTEAALAGSSLDAGYVFSDYVVVYHTAVAETLEEGQAAITGTMPASDVTITFNYAPRTDLSYTVNYLEQGTNTVLHEAKTVNGQRAYATVTEDSIAIAGYTVVAGQESQDLTISPEGENVITFYYTANTNTAYTVEHYQENLAGDGYTLADTENLTGTTGETATATSKTFEGFTFDADNANNVTRGTIAADGSLVLKLYYTRNSYTVTYQYTGDVPAGVRDLPVEESYRYGETVAVMPEPVVAGYTFSGWDTADAAISEGAFTMPAKPVTITGSFSQKAYTVTYDLAGGTVAEGTELTYTGLALLSATPTIPNPYKKGFDFVGWTPEWSSVVTGDVTYVAQYKDIGDEYDVIYKVDDQEVMRFTYNEGQKVPVEERWAGASDWTTNDVEVKEYEGIGKLFTMPAHDVVFTATTQAQTDTTYQVITHYVARNGSEVTVDSGEGEKAGEVGTLISNLYIAEETTSYGGETYLLDKVTLNGVAVNGTETLAEGKNVIDIYYDIDTIGTDDPDGPDDVPDKNQVIFTYESVDSTMGTVNLNKVVVTKDSNGMATAPQAAATALEGYTFVKWTESSYGKDSSSADMSGLPLEHSKDTWFMAFFETEGGQVDPGPEIYPDIPVYFMAVNGRFPGGDYTVMVSADENGKYYLSEEDIQTPKEYPGFGPDASWTCNNVPCAAPAAGTPVESGDVFVVTFDAPAQPEIYTVTYHWDGEYPAMAQLPTQNLVLAGEKYTIKVPQLIIDDVDGYWEFQGWRDRAGTAYMSQVTIAGDLDLYGTWAFKEKPTEPEPPKPTERFFVTKNAVESVVTAGDTIHWIITIGNLTDEAITLTVTDSLPGAVVTDETGAIVTTVTVPAQRHVILNASYVTTDADAHKIIENTVVVTDVNDPTEPPAEDTSTDTKVEPQYFSVTWQNYDGTVLELDPQVEKGTMPVYNGSTPTRPSDMYYVYTFVGWTPTVSPVTGNVVYTATYQEMYIPPYIPPTDPGTDIDDPDVPLADLPGLNTVDHYAYIAGYEDGTVRPNNNITRAEVATIFFRLFTDEYRETYWSTNNPFSDVAYTAWYNNAVSTTSNAGIIAGYPDGTFQPNNYITRAEFATIAARFLSEEYVGPDLFTDISGHWAAEYINRAANAGWINGYPDGSFRPNAYITRAEAMTLVNSMLGRMPHKDHMLENMVKWPDNPEAAWYYEAVQEATNGHDYDWYEEEDQLFYEIWTALQPNRDWAALEKEWSNAYSAPGGEVIG